MPHTKKSIYIKPLINSKTTEKRKQKMAISLSKGLRINLSKEAPGLSKLMLGLGWDSRVTDGKAFDADVSVLMLGEDGKAIGEQGFVFYGAPASGCGSVKHNGDNTTGEGDGDDETVDVSLNDVPDTVSKLLIAVTIHEADERGQNFGQIENAYIRLVNQDGNADIARYDLTEDYSTETCLIFAEVYKKDGEWRAQAKGEGFAGGLGKFLEAYGLQSA
jgi:tellurium resistance protein TerD